MIINPASQSIIESLGGVVWEADPDTFQFSFVSPGAETMLGYSADEWRTPGFWRLHTHPDDVEWAAAYCQGATARGQDHLFDYRMIAADGRVVWVRDVVTVDWDADSGRVLRGVMLDITEQVSINAELRRREARYRAFTLATAQVVWVADGEGRIVEDMPEWRALTGQTTAELMGFGWAAAVDADDRDRLRATMMARIPDRKPFSADYRLVLADRTKRHVRAFAVPVFDDAGKLVEWVGTLTDVPAATEMEDQLLQSQRMEALGRLAGGIAHDFNNILTVISGYGAMLRSTCPEGDERREFALEIERAAVSAAMLTRQLLAFGRKQATHPRVLDANELIDEMSGMLRRVIGESIVLELDLDRSTGAVLIDPGYLQQVLMNLAVNGRDAMPSGGVVRIATGECTVAGGSPLPLPVGRYVRLSVSDTGEGIPVEIQSRIFEPFFTTKDPGRGTGLGLSTAYGIVSQARGHIGVSSDATGTTFEILLPKVGSVPGEADRAPTTVAPPAPATILLVEDDDAVRAVAARVLSEAGHSVLAARSGAEAVSISAQHPGRIDLVIIDVVLPNVSGPVLVERLEAARPEMAVLYMSGYPDQSVVSLGVEEHVAFIQKPFSARELRERVRESLDGNRSVS